MTVKTEFSSWRINVLFALLVCVVAVLIGRVVLLQVLDVDKGYRFLKQQGEQRFIRTVFENAPRGEIVDRHGKQLAISCLLYTSDAADE